MKTNFVNIMKRTGKAIAMSARKHAPEIFLGTGIVATGVGVVLACKATRKADTVRAEHDQKIAESEALIGQVCEDGTTYTEEDAQMDIHNEKIKKYVDVVKAYLPAGICIVGGMALTVGGHIILRNRYSALCTAYNGLSLAYAKLKKSIQDNAEELGYSADKVINQAQNETTKELKKIKDRVMVSDDLFDEGSRYFSQSNAINAAYLSSQMAYANQKLWEDGVVSLADVRKGLGLKVNPIHYQFGWVKGEGDNYVDFGRTCERFIHANTSHELENKTVLGVALEFNCISLYNYSMKDLMKKGWSEEEADFATRMALKSA